MKIRINLSRQTLELFDDSGKCLRNYAVSTSKMGPGEQRGSNCTPRNPRTPSSSGGGRRAKSIRGNLRTGIRGATGS